MQILDACLDRMSFCFIFIKSIWMQAQANKKLSFTNILKLQDDSDSDSDYAHNEIEDAICELLPAYFQYRQHLLNILNSLPVSHKDKLNTKLSNEELKKIKQKTLNMEKIRLEEYRSGEKIGVDQGRDKKYNRIQLGDHLISRRKQQIEQQKTLEERYHKKQINTLLFGEEIVSDGGHIAQTNFQEPDSNLLQQNTGGFYYPPQYPNNIRPAVPSEFQNVLTNENNTNKEERFGLTFNNPSLEDSRSRKSRKSSGSSKKQKFQIAIKDERQLIRQENEMKIGKQQIKDIHAHKKCNTTKMPPLSKEKFDEQSFEQISEYQNSGNLLTVHKNIAGNQEYETQSEANFDAKFNKTNNNREFDTLSHKKSSPSIFMLIEKQKIEKQRRNAEKIRKQVTQALCGHNIEQAPLKESQEVVKKPEKDNQMLTKNGSSNSLLKVNIPDVKTIKEMKESFSRKSLVSNAYSQNQMQGQYIKTLKYLLGEVSQLATMCEIYKFMLKNKQYEILTKISQNPNSSTISEKHLIKGITNTIALSQNKQSQKSRPQIILNKFFNTKKEINFDEFCEAFSTKIYENQFMYLCVKANTIKTHKTMELVQKLFSVWLEIQYFEQNIKETISHNTGFRDILAGILESVNNPGFIDLKRAEQFIFDQPHSRVNFKKTQIYFENRFPNLDINLLLEWGKAKKVGKNK